MLVCYIGEVLFPQAWRHERLETAFVDPSRACFFLLLLLHLGVGALVDVARAQCRPLPKGQPDQDLDGIPDRYGASGMILVSEVLHSTWASRTASALERE